MRLLLIALLIVLPAAAATLVSGAPRDQACPAVTATAEGFFAAWQDGRDIPAGYATHIYASRLDAGGAPLDTGALLLSGGREDELVPAVGWDGAGCLAVWHRGC